MASKNQFNPPPLRKITDFKSQLTGGGARSNLFECVLSFPEIAQVENDVLNKSRFLIKAANLPASNVAFIDVPFRGRTLKVAGDRSFESWTITVINDTDFAIRSAFENWINKINRVSDGTGEIDPNNYTSDAYVYQLDRNGDKLKTYTFRGAYPQDLSEIAVSYADNDNIERFTCTWAYQYFESNTTS